MAQEVVTLILGGARSGKSEFAERLVGSYGSWVRYVATGAPGGAGDTEWDARVRAHQLRRPQGWETVEVPPGGDLTGALDTERPVLLDALGTWVAQLVDFGEPVGDSVPTRALLAALSERHSASALTVVVSEEVGLGVHPSTEVGRAFRDALGRLNARVAGQVADEVLMIIAGRVLALGPRLDEWIDTRMGNS
jgi:adenosylcobinamide kinase / adenosylcobinamide-phosphate guanylyltransferase